MTPKLYYSPGACSLAAHIVLEWIGRPYEAVRVDLHHLDPGYLRINPAGAVPALDVGGEVAITQASAVLTYLARTHPEVDLLDERTPESAAQLNRWLAFFTGDLHPAFWPVFTPFRYTTGTSPAALAAVKAAGLILVRGKMKLLDERLRGREWITGDKRTIADAYATPMLTWGDAMLPEKLSEVPAVAAHLQRMLADPAVAKVLASEQASLAGVEG